MVFMLLVLLGVVFVLQVVVVDDVVVGVVGVVIMLIVVDFSIILYLDVDEDLEVLVVEEWDEELGFIELMDEDMMEEDFEELE